MIYRAIARAIVAEDRAYVICILACGHQVKILGAKLRNKHMMLRCTQCEEKTPTPGGAA